MSRFAPLLLLFVALPAFAQDAVVVHFRIARQTEAQDQSKQIDVLTNRARFLVQFSPAGDCQLKGAQNRVYPCQVIYPPSQRPRDASLYISADDFFQLAATELEWKSPEAAAEFAATRALNPQPRFLFIGFGVEPGSNLPVFQFRDHPLHGAAEGVTYTGNLTNNR